MQVLWIAAFGVVGVLSRYAVDQLAARWVSAFPFGTLLVNIVGCAIAGIVFELGASRGAVTPHVQTAILVGFAGGFTTFSAYCLQASVLLEKGAGLLASLYLVGSPVLGMAALLAARALVRA